MTDGASPSICASLLHLSGLSSASISKSLGLTGQISLECDNQLNLAQQKTATMPGTFLGILLEFLAEDGNFPLDLGTLLPLFLGWQITVAAIIGYCTIPRSGDGKPAPH
jgi:hypothetical protein